ncbi:unnamed protein product, partial [Brassica rapa]
THIKSCKLTKTLKKWLTVDLKVDRELELKDRQSRRCEDRDIRCLWWVCIVLLPEKTRSDGGDTVKTERIRGDAVRTETVFVLGLPPWWVSILNLAEKKTKDRNERRRRRRRIVFGGGGFRSVVGLTGKTRTATEDRWWRLCRRVSIDQRFASLSHDGEHERERGERGEKKLFQKRKENTEPYTLA